MAGIEREPRNRVARVQSLDEAGDLAGGGSAGVSRGMRVGSMGAVHESRDQFNPDPGSAGHHIQLPLCGSAVPMSMPRGGSDTYY
jgi:hypothetical protein